MGVDPGQVINTGLVSTFQKDLLEATILLRHWTGRNSRGVSQFDGRTINRLIEKPSAEINESTAKAFLEHIISRRARSKGHKVVAEIKDNDRKPTG